MGCRMAPRTDGPPFRCRFRLKLDSPDPIPHPTRALTPLSKDSLMKKLIVRGGALVILLLIIVVAVAFFALNPIVKNLVESQG